MGKKRKNHQQHNPPPNPTENVSTPHHHPNRNNKKRKKHYPKGGKQQQQQQAWKRSCWIERCTTSDYEFTTVVTIPQEYHAAPVHEDRAVDVVNSIASSRKDATTTCRSSTRAATAAAADVAAAAEGGVAPPTNDNAAATKKQGEEQEEKQGDHPTITSTSDGPVVESVQQEAGGSQCNKRRSECDGGGSNVPRTEKKASSSSSSFLNVWITRANLEDDHQIPNPNRRCSSSDREVNLSQPQPQTQPQPQQPSPQPAQRQQQQVPLRQSQSVQEHASIPTHHDLGNTAEGANGGKNDSNDPSNGGDVDNDNDEGDNDNGKGKGNGQDKNPFLTQHENKDDDPASHNMSDANNLLPAITSTASSAVEVLPLPTKELTRTNADTPYLTHSQDEKDPTCNELVCTVRIKLAPSAKAPRLKRWNHTNKGAKYTQLPNGDCGDGIVNPYPTSIVDDKYWAQRKRLFTKFDEGIQMDQEAFYSVTPEAIAKHITNRLVEYHKTMYEDCNLVGGDTRSARNSEIIVLDAFVGVGGNAISFAQHSMIGQVVCCDTDIQKLQMAANNCRVYNIPPSKVVLIHANACHVLQLYKNGKLKSVNEDRTMGESQSNISSKFDKPAATANTGTILCTTQHGDDYGKNNTADGNTTDEYLIGGYELLPQHLHAIFLSPPWGGPNYEQETTTASSPPLVQGKKNNNMNNSNNNQGYDLSHIQLDGGFDGEELLKLTFQALPQHRINASYFLPRNVHGGRLVQASIRAAAAALAVPGASSAPRNDPNGGISQFPIPGFGGVELEQNILNYKLKTVTAYFSSSPTVTPTAHRKPENVIKYYS